MLNSRLPSPLPLTPPLPQHSLALCFCGMCSQFSITYLIAAIFCDRLPDFPFFHFFHSALRVCEKNLSKRCYRLNRKRCEARPLANGGGSSLPACLTVSLPQIKRRWPKANELTNLGISTARSQCKMVTGCSVLAPTASASASASTRLSVCHATLYDRAADTHTEINSLTCRF